MENKKEDNSKQDVMVSNLPLLFSDGKPTSITSMSVVCILFPDFGFRPIIIFFFAFSGGPAVLHTIFD